MRLHWTAVIAAASIIIPSSFASAQDRAAPGRWTPEAEQSRVGVETDMLHTVSHDLSAYNLTGDLTAQVGVTQHLFIDADFSAALFASTGVAEGMFGNPLLGAHYAARFDQVTGWYIGASVGIPLASAIHPAYTDDVAWSAIMVRAWREPGRFLPHSVPVVLRGGLELNLAPLILQVELAPGWIADFRYKGSIVYFDTSVSAALRARFGLEGGLRAQGTFVVAQTPDHAQTALEPFLGYETPERVGLYVRYGVLVAIDAPQGIGGYDTLTQRLSLGAKF